MFLLWKSKFSVEISLAGFIFWLAIKVRDVESAKGKRFNWLESIIRTLLLGFSGGTLVPIALGFRPVPMVNDTVMTLVIVVWWLAHYFPMDLFFRFYKANLLFRCVCVCLFETVRCNVMVKWLSTAHEVIPAGPYYGVPVWGPILAGFGGMTLGGFVVNGLASIEKETPWVVQSGMYASVFFHLVVFDPNVSTSLQALTNYSAVYRPIFGEWRGMAHVATIAFLAVCGVLQEIFGKNFNPFRPLHAVLYAVTGISSSQTAEVKTKSD